VEHTDSVGALPSFDLRIVRTSMWFFFFLGGGLSVLVVGFQLLNFDVCAGAYKVTSRQRNCGRNMDGWLSAFFCLVSRENLSSGTSECSISI
jgi:hypothetical protein